MTAPDRDPTIGATPFVQVPGGDPNRPRILLVSWHFPPGMSAGAVRWGRLAEHASRHGWALDVLMRHPDELDRRDDRGLERLPAGTRVFGIETTEPPESRLERVLHDLWRRFRTIGRGRRRVVDGSSDAPKDGPEPTDRPGSLARSETRLRLWSLEDLRRAFFAWLQYRREDLWAGRAVRVGRRILAAEDGIRVVVSCGPPHMAHEAARRLARPISLPFVMDLRDPWSQVQRLPEHHASPVWYALAARREKQCVRAADLVVANTKPARDALAASYPGAADRIIAVMNGFDDGALPGGVDRTRLFVIAHAGTVYLDRDPRALFRAVARLVQEQRLGPDRLRIRFFGCTDVVVRGLAREEGVESYVDLIPFLPRDELERRLVDCAVLVVLPQDSDLAIPSKVFDYMRYPARIVALAEDESATGVVLRDTPAAVIDPADVEGLAERLSDWLDEFDRGTTPSPVAESAPELSRRTQADRLFDRLERFR